MENRQYAFHGSNMPCPSIHVKKRNYIKWGSLNIKIDSISNFSTNYSSTFLRNLYLKCSSPRFNERSFVRIVGRELALKGMQPCYASSLVTAPLVADICRNTRLRSSCILVIRAIMSRRGHALNGIHENLMLFLKRYARIISHLIRLSMKQRHVFATPIIGDVQFQMSPRCWYSDTGVN